MTEGREWDRDFCPECGEEAEQYRKAILDNLLAVRRHRRAKTVCHVISSETIVTLITTVNDLTKQVEALQVEHELQRARFLDQREAMDILGDTIIRVLDAVFEENDIEWTTLQ